ncbi:MAG: aminopeptidase P family protein [Fimbriimonadaceae bacterium]|nr:aminopeptidase P family protein [Fimbriimonadaceae bacterium]
MSSPVYESRIEALAEQLRLNGCSAFFAWTPVAMGYIHGFHEGGHERFLALAVTDEGKVRMICPALSANQATRVGIKDVRTWQDGEDPLLHFQELVHDWGIERSTIAVDPDLPAHMLLPMHISAPNARFVNGRFVLSALMRVKSAEEIDLMRKAARIADDAWLQIPHILKAGKTERQVSIELEAEMSKRGGLPKFCIIATGANGAEPHHLSDDTVIQDGDVVILDFGCEFGGYQSDITRTVACGEPRLEAHRVYEIVYKAHMAAREHAKVGSTCESVDQAARQVIDRAEYGKYFIHRTGHGIGMQGHEEPNIVEGNKYRLEVGNCFSVEPGIYMPGRFGVRIENIVAMEERGCVSLNDEPSPTLTVIG